MSRNFDPRTGTVSLSSVQKGRISGAASNKNRTDSPSPPTRKLFIARTQEEMSRNERERTLNDEIMSLGLDGEIQEEPILEMITPQIPQIEEVTEKEEETILIELPTEVIIETVTAPEPSIKLSTVVRKRGRKKSRS